MPQVVLAIASIFAAIGFGAEASLALALMVLNLGVSLVLGEVSKLFQKGPSSSSLTSQLASRTVTSRQPVAPRRVLYGSNRVGGIITFLHTTGANNEKLHIVISLSGHEVNAITAMYFDGVAVPYDGSGNATGNFAGFAHVEFNLGTRAQASFPGLIAAAPAFWTAAHRQRGCAGAYVALTWDVNKFPNGVPNITFDVQGRKLYDPRTGTQVYSTNAALAIADYLTNARFGLVGQTKYPLTAAMLTNSGMTGFNAAQCVDADITTAGFNTGSAVTGATVTIDLGAGVTGEFRRCRLYLSASLWLSVLNIDYSDDNSTWHSAATSFAPDIIGWNEVELAPNGAHRYWRIYLTNTPGAGAMTVNEIELYSSDVDSVQLIAAANTCDEAVALSAGGNENRFTINGSFDTSEAPAAVIGRMNSAMAGSVLYIAGLWGIFPGIWRAPTISLSDSDLRAAFTVQTRMPHRNLYNGVKGTYISPTNAWQISDYPPFQSAAYLQEDNNEPLWLDVELPFTTSGATAQRLSKIALRRARRQITVQAQFKLTAYQVQPLDVLQFSHPRFGWVNKTFEVTACSLVYGADSQNAMALGVDLTLRESDSTVFDWTIADEVQINAPPTTILPSNLVCQPPTGATISAAEIVRTIDGIRTNFIALSWTAPADQFVLKGGHIIIQYKKHTDSLWTDIGKIAGDVTKAQIGPILDGIQYDIQMWAQNASGVNSTTVVGSVTANGTAVTLDTIADGSVYPRTPQMVASSLVVDNANFEASSSILPPPGWAQYGDGVSAYQSVSPYSGLRSINVATAAGGGGIVSVRKYACRAGDVYRVSGRARASVSTTATLAFTFRNGNGASLLDAIAITTSTSWAFITGSAIAPAGTVYATIECYSTAAGHSADFDEIHIARMQTAFELTPINTSGHSTGGAALSQSGTTTTINVASSIVQFGDGTVAYNSGSVNPGAYGTYFIYADDPGYTGGAVTYAATTVEANVYANNGRIYFGKITTAGGGGAVSIDPPGSGGGRTHLF